MTYEDGLSDMGFMIRTVATSPAHMPGWDDIIIRQRNGHIGVSDVMVVSDTIVAGGRAGLVAGISDIIVTGISDVIVAGLVVMS